MITHDKVILNLDDMKSTILADFNRQHYVSWDDESSALMIRGKQAKQSVD